MNGHRQPGKFTDALDWHIPAAAPPSSSRGAIFTTGGINWGGWLRAVERKRRQLLRAATSNGRQQLPAAYFARATYASFRLDGIDVTEHDVITALAAGRQRQALRSRAAQRIRNHVSILRHIESAVTIGESLKTPVVMRWYTTVGSGLINAGLSDGTMDRLDQVVRRINSPQLRLQPALIDVARLHVQLLTDPAVPSFNGILARLLLRYHLGRVGLPPVVFDPNTDAPKLLDDTMLLARLLELIDHSYELLLQHQHHQGNGDHEVPLSPVRRSDGHDSSQVV
jgi:hypothetical protein